MEVFALFQAHRGDPAPSPWGLRTPCPSPPPSRKPSMRTSKGPTPTSRCRPRGSGCRYEGVRGSGQAWGAVEAVVNISRDGEGRKGGALGSAHVCAGVSAHCARQGSRVGMLLGHPHPSQAASLCCSFSSLWLRTTRGLFPQRGGWEAVGCRRTVSGANPPLLLHFEPPPLFPPPSVSVFGAAGVS